MRSLVLILLLAGLVGLPAQAQMMRGEREAARSSEEMQARREAMREFRQQMRREEGRAPPRDFDDARRAEGTRWAPRPEEGRGLRRLSPEERVQLREQLRDGGRR